VSDPSAYYDYMAFGGYYVPPEFHEAYLASLEEQKSTPIVKTASELVWAEMREGVEFEKWIGMSDTEMVNKAVRIAWKVFESKMKELDDVRSEPAAA
jgi:hypothetical protein